jgi:hypothetical protein
MGLPLAIVAGAEVGGYRHLRDVELEGANHAAESGNDRLDFDVLELEPGRADGALLQGLHMGVIAKGGLEHEVCHSRTPLQIARGF